MQKNNITYLLLKSSWTLLSFIPLSIMYIFSDILFYPFYYVIRYRRKVARKNLVESFPEKNKKEIVKIEKRFYRFFLDLYFETRKSASISIEEMRKRMKFTNIEEVNKVLASGKSISLYLGHYCNWEWISSMPLSLNKDSISGQIYKRLSSVPVNKLLLKNRSRFGAVSVEMKETMRWISSCISEGKATITGYIADQSPKLRDSKYFLEFLNHQAPVLTGAEKITKRYGLEAYYLNVSRIKRGYYEASFVRLHEEPKTLPDYELTKIYYEHLERSIRINPEFYLWTHNRFKHSKKNNA